MRKPPYRPKGKITLRVAVNLMHRGSALIKTHGNGFYVVPGGYVTPLIAEQIMAKPNVRGQYDGLWPGMDQTWRVIR